MRSEHRGVRRARALPGKLDRKAVRLDQQQTKPIRTAFAGDIVLAKQTPPAGRQAAPAPKRRPGIQRPTRRKSQQKAAGGGGNVPAVPNASGKSGKKGGLSDWLTPKNIQESIKSVNNLRGMVKNCLNYLQQADQMLETFYVTSNSLRETGVLEKLVKGRGKNLTTEDFTGILAALMSSPIGGHLFKSMGGSDEETPEPQPNPAPPTRPQG